MKIEIEKIYTIDQIATAIGVHRTTIYRKIKKNILPKTSRDAMGRSGFTRAQLSATGLNLID